MIEDVLIGLGVTAGVVLLGYGALRFIKFMYTDKGGFGGGPTPGEDKP